MRPWRSRTMPERSGYQEQDAATRRAIAASVGETLFVEAGAGTGKTRALVDRVVALVLGGIPIERIAAITFTERAASEMRARVRSALEERARSSDAPAAVTEALASLDRVQISTIHSFCQSVLRQFAAQAGVDPDFTILDEVAHDRRRRERWREEIDRLATEAGAPDIIDRALSLGMTTREIEELAMEILDAGDLAFEMDRNPMAKPEPGWPDLSELAGRLEATGYRHVREEDRLRQKIEELAQLVGRLAANPRRREVTVCTVRPITGSPGNASDWGGKEHKARALDVAAAIADGLVNLKVAIRQKALSDLLPYLVRFAVEDSRQRAAEGALTFDDLILRAHRLVTGNKTVRAALRERFDVLLIDEFQDTDPLQRDIALAFANDPATGRTRMGPLFLVGDPKQSIYRFRGADMAVYSATRDWLEGVARFEELSFNKRTRRIILDWVNDVFASVIGGGSVPEVQPEYKGIHAERDVDLKGPGIACFGGLRDVRAAEVRAEDAKAVAVHCRRIVEDGWEVQERSGEIRPARFQDIAVLIPSRAGLTALERALVDEAVPFRVESGSLIFRTQEIRDLLNCLAAIDDPNDDVAIVGALRSPAFACSDADLAEFARAGGRFNYLLSDNDGRTGIVADALGILARYHASRYQGSLAGLIERFAAERGLVETGILYSGDRNAFRRVRYMVQQARVFEAAGPESLRSLVTWLERMADRQMLDNEGAALDSDEDAVQIHTVHGSKGLEFPIVIAAGLYSTFSGAGKGKSCLRDRATGRYAVSVGTRRGERVFAVGDVAGLQAVEEEHQRAEFRRMLYVAATRARDHLVVSLNYGSKQRDTGAQLLESAGARRAEALEQPPPGTGHGNPLTGLEVDLPPVEEQTQFAATREALVAAAKKHRYTSATAIKAGAPAGDGDDQPEPSDESEPWSRGRARTRVGRAVHATIQSLPLAAGPDDIAAFSRAQAVAEAIPHLASDVEALVRWVVIESDTWRRARAARRALRELPFAMVSDGTILEGFIDMVIEADDGLEIVDWKTDRISREEVAQRLREYELQAGLYVCGLQEATGRPVTAVTYVFASPGMEVAPGPPDRLAKLARTHLVDGLVSNPHLNEP